MTTITIENVPESVIKRFGTKLSFSTINISKKRNYIKKDPTIRLQKMIDDPKNTSYGTMSVDDFISEMKKW